MLYLRNRDKTQDRDLMEDFLKDTTNSDMLPGKETHIYSFVGGIQ